MRDRDIEFHKKWIGLAQPMEGLVFSVPVLADAQIAPDAAIGALAVVAAGVRVGSGAVIGAGCRAAIKISEKL